MTEGLKPHDDGSHLRPPPGPARADADDSAPAIPARSPLTSGIAGAAGGETLAAPDPYAPSEARPPVPRPPVPAPPPRPKPAVKTPNPEPTGSTTAPRSREPTPIWGENDSTPVPVVGGVLFGKYDVLAKIGEGGMGEVWLVRHRELEVERALKLIVSKIAIEGEARARFRREARAMARFSHPNAVTVHDADIRPDGGAAYIIMEYVRGQSLDKLLKPGTPMPLGWTTHILDQLCDVLQVAHEHGIVHRDLKPSNLILADGPAPGRERLMVLDFGIAKILGEGHEVLTRTGLPIGTPAYMSPEQIFSETGSLDVRSDLYSVGVILYEFLAGRRPFKGPLHKITYDHLHSTPPPFAEATPDQTIPPKVERVVMRCLEKDPAKRPQSARALAEEFHAALPSAAVVGPPGATRRRWLVAAAAGLPAVVFGVAWALGIIGLEGPGAPPPVGLSVRVLTEPLRLSAGSSKLVTLRITRGRSAGPVTVTPTPIPGVVAVEPVAGTSDDDIRLFNVTVDPGARTGPVAQRVSFRASAGALKANAQVALTIEPPQLHLPTGFAPATGAVFVKVNEAIYPTEVVRESEQERPVLFTLVRHGTNDDEPDTFYMMRDKVWVGLYREFTPGRPKDDSAAADPLWPVTSVSLAEAQEFARRLGGERGRLPTADQWDKAAGWWDRDGRRGPFLEPYQPGEIAIGLSGFDLMPVGKAAKDVSPLGCHDMAGNGLEWVRPGVDPLNVDLRGRRARASSPLLYEDLRNEEKVERDDPRHGNPEIGFRVVIELEHS